MNASPIACVQYRSANVAIMLMRHRGVTSARVGQRRALGISLGTQTRGMAAQANIREKTVRGMPLGAKGPIMYREQYKKMPYSETASMSPVQRPRRSRFIRSRSEPGNILLRYPT